MFIQKLMLKNNSFLEQNAVALSKIHPNHNVLEVGYGAGVGLEAAYQVVKGQLFTIKWQMNKVIIKILMKRFWKGWTKTGN